MRSSGKYQDVHSKNLDWVSDWFFKHCDKNWEETKRIKIGTITNPGWYIEVDLRETELFDGKFQEMHIERSDLDWFTCFKKDNSFRGYCGPFNLNEILQVFKTWVEGNENPELVSDAENFIYNQQDVLDWLFNWFYSYCDEDGGYTTSVHIENLKKPGWSLKIKLSDTALENQHFNDIAINNSQNDWLFCTVENDIFEGRCGSFNLFKLFNIFRQWAESNQLDI